MSSEGWCSSSDESDGDLAGFVVSDNEVEYVGTSDDEPAHPPRKRRHLVQSEDSESSNTSDDDGDDDGADDSDDEGSADGDDDDCDDEGGVGGADDCDSVDDSVGVPDSPIAHRLRPHRAALPADADADAEDTDVEERWVQRLGDTEREFLATQDRELGALEWGWDDPGPVELAMDVPLVTPGGAGRGAQLMARCGPLAVPALLEHVGSKVGLPSEPMALEFVAHPLTTPQYVNETWKVGSLAQLHALVHQINHSVRTYARRHRLHWRALADEANQQQHEGRLFRINVKEHKAIPTRTLWTGFLLGSTWDAAFRALGFCRTVYSLVNRDGSHAAAGVFVCPECVPLDEPCNCGAPETHDEQRHLAADIMGRVLGGHEVDDPAARGGRSKSGRMSTVPLYIRDAHFFKHYPRALLLYAVHTREGVMRCTMSNFRGVFWRVAELLAACPALRAWFQWNPAWW